MAGTVQGRVHTSLFGVESRGVPRESKLPITAVANPFEAERRALGLPPTLSKAEASDFSKQSTRSIERAIREGHLRATRAHRAGSSRVVILARDLLEYLGSGGRN